MAAAVAPAFVNMMWDQPSWRTIPHNFGLAPRAIDRFVEDYETANDLMTSDMKQITSVIDTKNKLHIMHAAANQRCYINTAKKNRILAFYRWTVFTFKDAHVEYNDVSAAAFDLDWINSVADEYLMPDKPATPQSTAFSVVVPRFMGMNWRTTKSQIEALFDTCMGNAGIPLTYANHESYGRTPTMSLT